MSSYALTQLRSLLARVKEAPQDVLPRLVLADWLEENGDEAGAARGEFIRLHCRPADHPLGSPERDRLSRQHELWERYRAAWLGPFNRGRAHCRLWGGLWLLWVKAEVFDGLLTQGLAESETWPWVASLKLSGVADADVMYWCPGALFDGLHRLDLSNNGLGDESARALAACPALAWLSGLRLERNRLGDEGARALAESPYLGRLTDLRVGENALNQEGLAALRERFGDCLATDSTRPW